MRKKDLLRIITSFYLFFSLTSIAFLLFASLMMFSFKYFFSDAITILCILSILYIIIIGFIVLKKIFLNISSPKLYKYDQKYIRDITYSYPPALASLLLNLNIESHYDYVATLLNLSSLGYIKINGNDIQVIRKADKRLMLHENYVIDNINAINENVFIEKVKEDGLNYFLIKEDNNKGKKYLKYVGILFLVLMIFSVIYAGINVSIQDEKIIQIVDLLMRMLSLLIFGSMVCLPFILGNYYKYNIVRTDKGLSAVKDLKNLKSFLDDFSNIKDKSLEHHHIYNGYIAYAISLGCAKKIIMDLDYDDQYRSFTL